MTTSPKPYSIRSVGHPRVALPAPHHGLADRLAAVVLLSGSVRPTGLRAELGRSLLDLPVEEDRSVLDTWMTKVQQFVTHFGLRRLPVRVMHSCNVPPPRRPETSTNVCAHVERDPYDLRGTGGVIADVARQYADDELIVVANGAQILDEELSDVVEALDMSGADLAMVASPDGTPADVILIRCGALADVPRVGFHDFKEQTLPAVARDHRVTVVQWSEAISLPVRTREQYIASLRAYYRGRGGHNSQRERWRRLFTIIEDGAEVDSRAALHDSIVLKGARITGAASIVRSIIGPGVVVRPRTRVVDQVLVR